MPSALVVTDPGSVVIIGLFALGYAVGMRRWEEATGRRMVARPPMVSFYAGLAVTAVAVASPLDGLESTSLTAHMVQHVLLLAVAGPLLALGAPLPVLVWALPPATRRRSLAWSRRVLHSHDRHFVGWVVVSLGLEAVVMWAWHAPDLYEAALHHVALHDFEHLCFVVSSAASWWTIANGRRTRRGAAAIAALVGSLPGMALGSALVLAPRPWYPTYVHGNVGAALVDQQLAGVVMWAFGGMAAVIAGAGLFWTWLHALSRDDAPVVAVAR